MEPRKTPLYQKHLEHHGRIVDFSGWALPIEYGSVLKEAKAVRQACGVFDASHMGEIVISGSGSLNFLQKYTPNDISLINCGQMQYNLFLNEQGGVVDDFMLYRKEKSFFCVVNASNKDKVLAWLNKNKPADVVIDDQSQNIALICLQGPQAVKLAAQELNQDLKDLEYMNFTTVKFNNRDVLISRSGYTGEDGFEIYSPWDMASLIWDKIFKNAKDYELMPCGLGARDILRIEAGYPLYGHEIDDNTNPYEASLAWVVKTKKDFFVKDKIAKEKINLTRKRVGFIMQERGVARQSYKIYKDKQLIGQVTSGTYSPNINNFVGMAYVKPEFSQIDTEIAIEVRNQYLKAKVAKFPFVQINTKKPNEARKGC